MCHLSAFVGFPNIFRRCLMEEEGGKFCLTPRVPVRFSGSAHLFINAGRGPVSLVLCTYIYLPTSSIAFETLRRVFSGVRKRERKLNPHLLIWGVKGTHSKSHQCKINLQNLSYTMYTPYEKSWIKITYLHIGVSLLWSHVKWPTQMIRYIVWSLLWRYALLGSMTSWTIVIIISSVGS